MDFDSFKDAVFELLNESDWVDLRDIDADDRAGTFRVFFRDGSCFCVSVSEESIFNGK